MADDRRRILFFIPTLRGGGAERVIVTLLRHLDRSKFRLTLAVVNVDGAAYRNDVPQDVEFIDLGCSRVRYALPKLVGLVWNRRPEVVFSTLGHLSLGLAILRPLLPKQISYIARETSVVSESICRYSSPSIWKWAYRRFYRRFDTVVCPSRAVREDLEASFALPVDKAVVIHNPVDIVRIRQLAGESLNALFAWPASKSQDRCINLVAAGRLTHEKGFDLLLKAIAICGNRRVRLTILGEGPLRAELERLARDTDIAQRVCFVGFQANPYPFFAQADAFVLSSRFEGFPNVVLEALACGTPIIATPAPGGTREILDGMAGCLMAESVSAEGIAQAIRVMRWNTRPGSMAVEPYAVNKIARRYEQLLSHAVV